MQPEIQKLVEAGRLTSKTGEVLSNLVPGTWVLHKSWGFGRIESWNDIAGQVLIDFHGRKAHPMQFQYAAETLQLIPEEHFLVKKATDAPTLKKLAAEDPAKFLRMVLADYDSKLTVDQISKLMVPDLMSEAVFKKWWESTKKLLKSNGLFALPAKRTDPVILRAQALSRVDELVGAFKSARQAKERIASLDQITRSLDVFTSDEAKLREIVSLINIAAAQNQKLHTAHSKELLVGRDAILEKFPSLRAGDALSLEKLLRDEESRLHDILPQVSAAKQRSVLAKYPAAFPERWVDKMLLLVLRANSRLVGEVATLLEEHGKRSELSRALDKAIRDQSISSEGLLWLGKERTVFPDFVNPAFLAAIFGALERDQFSEKKSSRLHDFLLDDRELIADALAAADRDEVRDVMRKLMLTPVFEELNKRSLLARIIKAHPEMQSMLTGETEEKEEALIVSWSSLEKRKIELEELDSKKIPENRRDIQIAREYGDLRENFEYKSAKDQQRVLMRRKAELEFMLNRARGTGFENPDTSKVSIGTVVTLADVASGDQEKYSILGAWDSEPEKGIISYLTAIGQALLGKTLGEEVELPTERGSRKVRLETIEAYEGELTAK
ncbi:MAG TPA: GreA/GreB family elongation factor [Chthoniobacterales bacterium]